MGDGSNTTAHALDGHTVIPGLLFPGYVDTTILNVTIPQNSFSACPTFPS
jgi:hypothetical protein